MEIKTRATIIDKDRVISAQHEAQPQGAFTTFNGLIYDMRQQGQTLEEIGRRIGRTRERVRQILNKHYGGTDINRNLVSTFRLAQEADCRPSVIRHLHQAGLITPIRTKPCLWNLETTLPIVIHNIPRCKICGRPVPKHRSIYCSDECRKEGAKWVNRSETGKRGWLAAMIRWRKANPEKAKKIQVKAYRRYYQKLREERYQQLLNSFTKIIPIRLK